MLNVLCKSITQEAKNRYDQAGENTFNGMLWLRENLLYLHSIYFRFRQ